MAEKEKKDNEKTNQPEKRDVFIRNVEYLDFPKLTKVYEFITKTIPLHILFQEVLGCPNHDEVYMYIERLYKFRDKQYTKIKPSYKELDETLTHILIQTDRGKLGKFRDLAHRQQVHEEQVRIYYNHIRRDIMKQKE